AALKTEKAKLEKQVVTAKPAAPDKDVLKAAEKKGFDQAKRKFGPATQKALNKAIAGAMKIVGARLGALTKEVTEDFKAMVAERPGLDIELTFEPSIVPPQQVARPAPQKAPQARPAVAAPMRDGDVILSNPQLTLLRSLAWWHAMGHDNPTRPQVAAICGWRVTAGHLKNVIGALNSAGFTE